MILVRFCVFLLLAPLLLFSNLGFATDTNAERAQLLRAKIAIQPRERLSVIVQFDGINDFGSELQVSDATQQGRLLADNLDLRRQALIERLEALSANSQGAKNRQVRRFKVSPLMALDVNSIELEELLMEPSIRVWEDKLMRPSLAQSIPLVYPTQDQSPYHGDNRWAVAVLDTGVDTNHPFLAGKLLAEACYSDGGGSVANGTSSLCPGGVTSSTAAGSGQACSATGCEHGTQVAGVAVGNGNSFDGIARDAKLISIQIYSQTDDLDFCPDGSCLGAYTSDLIAGLERVYELRNTYDIAAVNLSLGSSELFSGTCDDQPEKPIIDLLKQARIAVVAASGNSGQTSQMQSPACITSTIAVAASSDRNNSTWANNNTSSALDVFAPGINITSAVAGGGFSTTTGTSMAAPHVAGSLAVMRDASPNLSVNAAKNLITSSGPQITQNTVTKRRLDLSSILLKIDPSLQTIQSTSYLPSIQILLLDD
ncbi:S8/S53 family peptidase [Arenicella sp.]|nr:S8/S53 family peptidase [Arenicella sp.]